MKIPAVFAKFDFTKLNLGNKTRIEMTLFVYNEIMKMSAFCFVVLLVAVSSACLRQSAESQKVSENENVKIEDQTIAKQPVLVELFTSEGCSSCPPADRALIFLEREQPYAQAEIITLSLHVDYWNNLGWRDEFSSPLYSERQTVYARKLKVDSTYTPQMVVDGQRQFVGSNTNEAAKAIMEAARSPKARIETSLEADKLKINISALPVKRETATVNLAVTEDNLVSNVKRGENSGKVLEHTSVVRELKTLGTLDADARDFNAEENLKLRPEWKRENVKFVVFVQGNESRRVLGINRIAAKKTAVSE